LLLSAQRTIYREDKSTKGNKTMAKIARTPYNASRVISKEISSDVELSIGTQGYTFFVTATEAMSINVGYLDKGSYYKIILKENALADIIITLPSVSGVLISDDGLSGAQVVQDSGNKITIPSGAVTGTYIDLVCDGSKWYARGMSAGSAFTITTVQ
jgi:hypothetical protein